MKVYIDAATAYAPGLGGWETLDRIRNSAPVYEPIDESRYQPGRLPRNEKRRASELTRLAFRIAEAIADDAPDDFADIPTVFASAGGDYDVQHKINTALAVGDKQISPTEFHNSVHNAAGGYWGIATHCHRASTSLSAGDDTFHLGLMEAALIAHQEASPVLMVAADIKVPYPLSLARPLAVPFGAGLLLRPEPGPRSCFAIDLSLTTDAQPPAAVHPALAALLKATPVARALVLLSALAAGTPGTVSYGGDPGTRIDIEPIPG